VEKIIIKQAVSSILYSLGLGSLLSNNYKKSVILTYHHVLPAGDHLIDFIQPGMYVTEKIFEKHIEYLSQKYTIIPLYRLHDIHAENTCIITFDDGWADNYQYAFPILRKFNVPATIFVSTNLINTINWPWPDRIGYYLRNATIHNLTELSKLINGMKKSFKACPSGPVWIGDHGKYITSEYMISYLKQLPHETLSEIMEVIDSYMEPLGGQLKYKRPWLTWDEIRDMSEQGISFGSHTHNHIILTKTTMEDAREEINLSKKILFEKLHHCVNMFSFPNGDYNEKLIDILKDQQFEFAVTTRSGSIDKSENLLTLRRFMIHNDMTKTIPMLVFRLSGRVPYF
jgi:peptidoglycan/xylan/chitin deacetylase (PgdA/CDA1 family)